jgi:CubicO group peptidase (beta-lactamase class C family)
MFEAARRVLEDAVASRAFPGAIAEAGTSSGPRWSTAVGRLTYKSDAPAVAADTIYDLASLTKVVATTSIVMQLLEAGAVRLDDAIRNWLRGWRGRDREGVTIRDLLAHSSGLTAHLPFYRELEGRAEFEAAICELPLEYPPGSASVYSDLGFMLLAFVAENASGRRLESLFDDVLDRIGRPEILFRPSPALRPRIAPTEMDAWRGRMLTGEVHDQNGWALGGVAGHAGLFGTASAVGTFARAVLRARRAAAGLVALVNGVTAHVASPSTVAEFTTRSSVPGSSRALGWDTMRPTSSCGTWMLPTAIGHTGFTGTSLWIDWERDAYAVLLSNRVHPTADNQQILTVRPRFHDAIMGEFLG